MIKIIQLLVSAMLISCVNTRTNEVSLLRYDGVYKTSHQDNGSIYYRFYPDGKVISIATNDSSPKIFRKWFTKDNREIWSRNYEVNGSRISFAERDWLGSYYDYRYDGIIKNDRLILQYKFPLNGNRVTRDCTFVKW